MTYDVYGHRLSVERLDGAWRLWQHGADGKRRPAPDIHIPAHLGPEDIETYLADLCHEWASQRCPRVKRLD